MKASHSEDASPPSRRDFHRLAALTPLAIAGLVSGASSCGGGESAEEPAGDHDYETAGARHACAGMNECKGQGGCETGDNGCAGKNSCEGKGGCATVAHHGCAGMNECKGLGGCASGDNGCAGKNSCKGKGGCAVPVTH